MGTLTRIHVRVNENVKIYPRIYPSRHDITDRLNSCVVYVEWEAYYHMRILSVYNCSPLLIMFSLYQCYYIICNSLFIFACISRHTHVITQLTLHTIMAHFNTRSGLFLTTPDLYVQVQEHGIRSMITLSGDHRLPAQLVEASSSLFLRSLSPQLIARPSSPCGSSIIFHLFLHCNSFMYL